MPRQKLSEFRAKSILTDALGLSYSGCWIDAEAPLAHQLKTLPSAEAFVVKVDEAVKGRFKKGLVLLDVKRDGLAKAVETLKSKGFRWLIIEPMQPHDQAAERYLSITSAREGLTLHYTAAGGVDVEQYADKMKQAALTEGDSWKELAQATGFSEAHLKQLVDTFRRNYFVFLEINPYVVKDGTLQLLDAAVEVDDAGLFFVDSWHESDFRRHSLQALTPEEVLVQELDVNSPASLKLSVLEPNGSVFLLLSGGGASVVVADEVYNQKLGDQLANYGEYSGNPNTEETYAYTKAVLDLLLKSSANKKVLFIGGAVANFTDVAKTFAGVIQAIDEQADALRAQGVKVFVRRGGPNQETGLAKIEATLKRHGLLGAVHDPATPLTVALSEALREVA